MTLADFKPKNGSYTALTPYGFGLRFDPMGLVVVSSCCRAFLAAAQRDRVWAHSCLRCNAVAMVTNESLGYGASLDGETEYLELALSSPAAMGPLEACLRASELADEIRRAREDFSW